MEQSFSSYQNFNPTGFGFGVDPGSFSPIAPHNQLLWNSTRTGTNNGGGGRAVTPTNMLLEHHRMTPRSRLSFQRDATVFNKASTTANQVSSAALSLASLQIAAPPSYPKGDGRKTHYQERQRQAPFNFTGAANNSLEIVHQFVENGFSLQSPNHSLRCPQSFSRISIKAEHNAFTNQVDQSQHHYIPNMRANNNAFSSQSRAPQYDYPAPAPRERKAIAMDTGESKVQEALSSQLNRLSFQNVIENPLTRSRMKPTRDERVYDELPGNRYQDLKRVKVTNAKVGFQPVYERGAMDRYHGQMLIACSPVRKRHSEVICVPPELSEEGVPPRRKWTRVEDELLREAVAAHGEKNWKTIARYVQGRNHVQCLQRWKKVLKPGLKKGHWTKEEDDLLKEVVGNGFRNWGEVALKIEGRTAKQCRERWSCNLDPSINKEEWTEEEDAQILAAQKRLGNKWSTIAQMLPGRTENAIKTRAKSLLRKEQKKWTKEEDDLIISLKTIKKTEEETGESKLGFTRSSAWAKIAMKLPGRSKNAVKKRWKELKEQLIAQNAVILDVSETTSDS